jgi:hypothetical protein
MSILVQKLPRTLETFILLLKWDFLPRRVSMSVKFNYYYQFESILNFFFYDLRI